VGDLLDLPEPHSPPEVSKPGFLSRTLSRIFLARRSDTLPRETFRQRTRELAPVPQSDIYDVDKYWHILHFLFTGTAWEGTQPKAFLASGGSPVGRELGYGPPRLFEPEELQAISSFLETLTFEEFASGYVSESVMDAELYYWRPGSTAEELSADLETLWAIVGEMREFLANTAKHGDGILVEIY
jgi:hypothetical protein